MSCAWNLTFCFPTHSGNKPLVVSISLQIPPFKGITGTSESTRLRRKSLSKCQSNTIHRTGSAVSIIVQSILIGFPNRIQCNICICRISTSSVICGCRCTCASSPPLECIALSDRRNIRDGNTISTFLLDGTVFKCSAISVKCNRICSCYNIVCGRPCSAVTC